MHTQEGAGSVGGQLPRGEYTRRLLIALTLIALALAAWQLATVLVLAFGGMLLATLILVIAAPVQKHSHLSQRAAVAAVIVGIAAVIVALGWLFGYRLAGQLEQLSEQLPRAWSDLQRWLGTVPGGEAIIEEIQSSAGSVPLARLTGLAWSLVGGLARPCS